MDQPQKDYSPCIPEDCCKNNADGKDCKCCMHCKCESCKKCEGK